MRSDVSPRFQNDAASQPQISISSQPPFTMATLHHQFPLGSVQHPMETIEPSPASSLSYTKKICIAFFAIFFIVIEIIHEAYFLTRFEDNTKFYWFAHISAITIDIGILFISICIQHKQIVSYKLDKSTMQSFKTNAILLFLTAIYLSTLSALAFYQIDSSNHAFLIHCFDYFFMLIVLFLVGIHFLCDLKWSKISNDNNLNWWSSIYLSISLFDWIMWFALYPWIHYDEFIHLSETLNTIAGEFVVVLIMYICRPSLTVVAFRCCEQIIHQLIHQYHNKHIDNAENIDLCYNLIIDKEEILLRFNKATATNSIVLSPIILFLIVIRLLTLSSDIASTLSTVSYLIWSFIFLIQIIWSIYIANKVYGLKTNNMDLFSSFSKHIALLISSIGQIISIIGILGKYCYIWEILMLCIFDIVTVLLQCCVLIILNEIKLDKSTISNMSWYIKSYGIIMIVIHGTAIFEDFIGEGYHLEETLNTNSNHEVNDIFAALAFVFFFWRIEFHLSCIERINFVI